MSWAEQGEEPEDATPGRASEVENIIITAERRESALQETPVSVTAFTPTAIEELDITNAKDVAEFTPNLNIHTNAGGNTGLTIGIRGAITSDPVLSLEPTVGIYMNGVYIGKSVGALFDVVDLADVEVLRGPQGTLYGRNTVGGAITLETVRPKGDWGAKAQVRAGNHFYVKTIGSIDAPLLGGNGIDTPSWLGTLSARVSFMYESREGFYNNTGANFGVDPGSKRFDDLNRWSGIVSAAWELPWEINLDYTFDTHTIRELPSVFQLTAADPAGATGFLVPFEQPTRSWSTPNNAVLRTDGQAHDQQSDLDVWGHAISLSREIPDTPFIGTSIVKAIIGLRDMENSDNVDYDGSPINVVDFGLDTTHGQTSVELQWVGENVDHGVDYVLGFYYYEEDATAFNSQMIFGGFSAVNNAFTMDNYSLAPFGQITWALPFWERRLAVTGGLRYTYESKKMGRDYECFSSPPAGVCADPGDPGGSWTDDVSDTFDDVSPMANISAQFTDEIMGFFRFSKGFKSGGFNGRETDQDAFQTPYKSEKLWAYELGTKTTWLENRLLVNVGGFFSDYDDIQVTVFAVDEVTGEPVTRLENAGKAEIWGVELEAIAVPIEGLNLRLAYAYLNPDYKEFIIEDPDNPGDLINVADERDFILAPEHTISAGIGYTFAPFSFGTLYIRTDMYWQDAVVFATVDNDLNSQGSYATMSARSELADIPIGGGDYGHLAVAIWGQNLTDTKYREFGIDWGALGYAGNTYGKPRTYGADLTWTW